MSLLDRQELAKRLANGEKITPQSIVDEFKLILKDVIEEASNAEITEHLGYDKHHTSDNTNYRNGYNTKTLKTNYGEILVDIPRDRDGTFNPKLVKKREVVLNGTDDLVISLYAKGMSVRDIKSHLEQLYGFELSEQTISNMTEKILDKAKEWQNRPLDRIYPFVIIDATILKVRIDGNVKNIATYIMLGVKLDGSKEILGMWISKDCEQSVYWLDIFNEIKNRGVDDILIISTDNLSGISKAINSSFPNTQILLLAATSAQREVEKCVIHQIRNSLKYVSYKDKKRISSELKAIYEADTKEQTLTNLAEFKARHQGDFPNIAKSWENNFEELSTYFRYPKEIRKLIYSTNAIESLNSIIKRKTSTKAVFPTIDSAFKLLCCSILEISEKWKIGKIRGWDKIYPQLSIYFSDTLEKYE